jgi:hypothetical protein
MKTYYRVDLILGETEEVRAKPLGVSGFLMELRRSDGSSEMMCSFDFWACYASTPEEAEWKALRNQLRQHSL